MCRRHRGTAFIICVVVLLGAGAAGLPHPPARDIGAGVPAQNPPPGNGEARLQVSLPPTDSDAAAFRAAMRRMSSPEFERRKVRRLELQRRGYAAILHELLRRRGLGAFLAMVRTKAQLDIHLPQNTLVVTVPVLGPPPGDPRLQIFAPPSSPPMGIPLIEDRRFPENPWRK